MIPDEDLPMIQSSALWSGKKLLYKWTKVLFGNPAEVSLENRAFTATLFLVFCAGVGSVFINISVGGSVLKHVLSFSAILLSSISYAISRFTGVWKPMVLPVYVLFLCLLSLGWMIMGGLSGIGAYYFFLLTCAAIIVFDGFWKMFALLLVLIFASFLIILEFFHPELIIPYASIHQRYKDVSFSFILCLLANGSMTYIIFREFHRERATKNMLLESIVREKEKVEKAVSTTQRLLSMVCHDISNALTMVLANTSGSIKVAHRSHNTFNDPENHFDLPGMLDNVKYGALKINEIIESVRLMQAMEDGTTSVQLSRVYVADILENLKRLFFDRLHEKNLRLEISLPQPDPFTVQTEPKIFCNHILSNLLSNAIKYSYTGSIIKINGWKQDGKKNISITDQGIGIPQDIKEHLFLPGFKVGRIGTQGERGTGFGLLVVKSFIELLGAHIKLESKPEDVFPAEHGTTIEITFKDS